MSDSSDSFILCSVNHPSIHFIHPSIIFTSIYQCQPLSHLQCSSFQFSINDLQILRPCIQHSIYFPLKSFHNTLALVVLKVINKFDLGPPQSPWPGPSSPEWTFQLEKYTGQSQQASDISLTFPSSPCHSLYMHLLVNSMMALHKRLDFFFPPQWATGKHITFYKTPSAKCKTSGSLTL